METTPPRFGLKLLKAICPGHLYEEIEGDLVQGFERDVKLVGERKARKRFLWSVVRFCRPGIVFRSRLSIEFNPWYMIRNYFIMAYRHLLKNRTFSFINITGLAVGMAAFLLIVHYVRFERSYENFHKNAGSISRVTLDIYKGSEFVVADCGMYAPIGQMLKNKFPEVLDFTRLSPVGGGEVVKRGDEKFYEKGIFLADPSVFRLFSFEVIDGKAELVNPFQCVLTQSMAQKYFGKTDVAGETLQISGVPLTITAVMADIPPNTHFKFNFLVSHSTMAKLWDYKDDEFNGNDEFTYLLMNDPMDLADFNNKLLAFSIEIKDKIGDDRIVSEPMKDIHLYSNKGGEMEANGSIQSVYFLMIVGAFIIFIAWINYINLSTAKATERAHEVGIRKVMGSLRRQLIFQFLAESIIITLIAVALCLFITYSCLPIFVALTGQYIPLNIFGNKEFWYLVLCVSMTGALLAGLYPAVVLSSFKPVQVLKGRILSLNGQWFRKGLVVFQFTTTVILIVCMCVVYFQVNYLQNYKLGMSLDQTLVIRSPDMHSDSLFKVKALELTKGLYSSNAVEMVSQSAGVPGGGLSTTGNVLRPGQEKNDKGLIYHINGVDENFIPLFQMQIESGRNFDGNPGVMDQVIINEESVRALGFRSADEAVGSKVLVYNREKAIIGVLKNFHHRSPKEAHLPMVFQYIVHANFFSVKIRNENVQATVEGIKETWSKLYPENPFDYFFLRENYQQQYKAEQKFGTVIATFCVLAGFIACLGLFGLSAYTVTQRKKEISVRKVLGASVNRIVLLLSQDFVLLVLIATFIAMPVAYLAMEEWLSGYAVRFSMTLWVFVFPMTLILLISFLTISFQTVNAAQANPVDALKNE